MGTGCAPRFSGFYPLPLPPQRDFPVPRTSGGTGSGQPGLVQVMAFLQGFWTVCPRRIPEWGRVCWWLAGERGEVECGGVCARYLRVFAGGFPAGSIGLRRLFRRPPGGFSVPRSPRGMGSGQTGVHPSRDGPCDGLSSGFSDGLSPQNPGMGEGVLVVGGRKGRGGVWGRVWPLSSGFCSWVPGGFHRPPSPFPPSSRRVFIAAESAGHGVRSNRCALFPGWSL